MAPKRSNPIENPPDASSSEEEVTSSDEEEEEEGGGGGGSSEEDDDEDEDTQPTPLTQKNPPSKKPENSAPAGADDESDETESDSESGPNVKPIATKSMEETTSSKKPRSKPLASPVKASSAKRPSESNQEPKEAKRPKKKSGEEGTGAASVEEVKKTGEDSKKQLFQRLFTEDDEIAVLKGMLDYSEKKGSDPLADMNAFYDFVKKSIHTDVTKAQLMDKIRRLKKKFENNAGKGKRGEDRTFSKDHDREAFKLSKMIWGEDGISGKVESSAARSNGKAKALAASKAELPSSPVRKVEFVEPMEVDKKSSKSLGSLFNKRVGADKSIFFLKKCNFLVIRYFIFMFYHFWGI
ncbi:hypothetical protein PTKIN_Ptkin14bG0212900 [Pterospermum kingtungense]